MIKPVKILPQVQRKLTKPVKSNSVKPELKQVLKNTNIPQPYNATLFPTDRFYFVKEQYFSNIGWHSNIFKLDWYYLAGLTV